MTPEFKGKITWTMTRKYFFAGKPQVLERSGSGEAKVTWTESAEFRGWSELIESCAKAVDGEKGLDKALRELRLDKEEMAAVTSNFWASPVHSVTEGLRED